MEKFQMTVAPDQVGVRLDQFLATQIPGLSRRKARVLIDIGGVFIDRHRSKIAGRTMRAGEEVSATLGGALDRATAAVGAKARMRDEQDFRYEIVHEDEEVIVVDKPAGLLVAPTPESDRQNLESLLARRPGGQKVFVVHRIDLETSGLLVFAKTPHANRFLSERFRVHDLEREYTAVVLGVYPEHRILLDAPVGGREARTHIKVAERFADMATLLACRLETGRTHQIRIHARTEGHPVLGDRRYGLHAESFPFPPPRMALHARRLAFRHPSEDKTLDFSRELPEDLAQWLTRLREAMSSP